ncbi:MULTISPECIES: FIST C-terminal domain-containing protein [unclassified Thioalkalivibrio]|uniref:FIST signal transduction protein n=1 Tax=unclassified Thioalkalivibrio TaxID=2621013 RepID=UPI00035C4A21|nr:MULTISPECIES: FIST C-terminal domain-containing protein [unclassified Thioalkalivibrio]
MTTPFRSATARGDEPGALATTLIAELGEQPVRGDDQVRVGFIYLSDPLSRHARSLLKHLREGLGIDHFVGGMAMAIIGPRDELYEQPGVTLMIGEFPASSVRVIYHPVRRFEDLVQELDGFLDPQTPGRLILNADPQTEGLEDILTEIGEQTAWFATGGVNSGEPGVVQIADGVSASGITGLALRDDVAIAARHSQGCTPLPGQHELTETWRNIIVRLDGQQALPAFKGIIGDVLSRDLERALGYILVGFPIAGSDTGDYRVRNIIGVDLDQEVLAIGEMLEPGSQILFVRRDGQAARDDLERMLEQVRAQAPNGIRGALYVSCVGRGRHQFGQEGAELAIVQKGLGDVPLVGFFANGEIFANRLYGYTGVLTLFT